MQANTTQAASIELSSLDKFKENCDLIIANRVEDELRDVSSKIFTRDVFGNN